MKAYISTVPVPGGSTSVPGTVQKTKNESERIDGRYTMLARKHFKNLKMSSNDSALHLIDVRSQKGNCCSKTT